MNLIGKTTWLGIASRRNANLGLKFCTSFGALSYGLFGLNEMASFLTQISGMNLKLKTSLGRVHGLWQMPMLSWNLTRLGGHITSCATVTNLGFHGTGGSWTCNNIGLEDLWVSNSFFMISNLCDSRLDLDFGHLVAWGCPW